MSRRKLLLCAGRHRWSGYVRLDANQTYDPDIVATIPPLPKFDQSWDEIALIHGIEHFYFWDAGPLVKAVHDSLAPSGLFVLEQPDIRKAAAMLLGLQAPISTQPGQSDMWAFYGDPTDRNPLYVHKWGYSPETLAALLRDSAPWSSIDVKPARHHVAARDFRIEARK